MRDPKTISTNKRTRGVCLIVKQFGTASKYFSRVIRFDKATRRGYALFDLRSEKSIIGFAPHQKDLTFNELNLMKEISINIIWYPKKKKKKRMIRKKKMK